MLRLEAPLRAVGEAIRAPRDLPRYRVGVIRQCSRTGCADHATATLSYQYASAQVWLDDLRSERVPHDYDLCERHSGRVSVPNGWHLEDRRARRLLLVPARLAG